MFNTEKKEVVNSPFNIFPKQIWIKIGLLLDDVELVPFLAALKDLNMLQFPTYRTPTIPSLPEELRIEAVLSERIVKEFSAAHEPATIADQRPATNASHF